MKNLQTKISLPWGLLIVVIVLGFGYAQLGWFNTSEYLLSVTAEEGAVIGPQDTNGCFDLTLKGADHVIWFSDRPERTAFSTDMPLLLSIWQEEFGTNPPNADLQLFRDGSDAVVILTLESTPVWNKDARTLIFEKACPIELASGSQVSEVEREDIIGSTFSKAVLFIDGVLQLGDIVFVRPTETGEDFVGPRDTIIRVGCRPVEVDYSNLPQPINGEVFYPIDPEIVCDGPIQRIEVDYGTQ